MTHEEIESKYEAHRQKHSAETGKPLPSFSQLSADEQAKFAEAEPLVGNNPSQAILDEVAEATDGDPKPYVVEDPLKVFAVDPAALKPVESKNK